MFNEQSQEKTIVEKIAGFKNAFELWLQENPVVAQQLKHELLTMAGVEENELTDPEMGFDLGLIKVPASELSIFSTSCGTKGNKPFSQDVLELLQSKGIEFVIGLGENNVPVISSAAINLSEPDAEQLSKLVEDNHGSLQANSSEVSGWSIFESE